MPDQPRHVWCLLEIGIPLGWKIIYNKNNFSLLGFTDISVAMLTWPNILTVRKTVWDDTIYLFNISVIKMILFPWSLLWHNRCVGQSLNMIANIKLILCCLQNRNNILIKNNVWGFVFKSSLTGTFTGINMQLWWILCSFSFFAFS